MGMGIGTGKSEGEGRRAQWLWTECIVLCLHCTKQTQKPDITHASTHTHTLAEAHPSHTHQHTQGHARTFSERHTNWWASRVPSLLLFFRFLFFHTCHSFWLISCRKSATFHKSLRPNHRPLKRPPFPPTGWIVFTGTIPARKAAKDNKPKS